MASSAFKICPTCQKRWAATFKFCPEHGSQLVDEAPPEPAAPKARSSRRSSRILDLPPVTASPTSPATPAAPAPAPPKLSRGLVRGGAAVKSAPPAQRTVADAPAAPTPKPGPTPKASRTAPTLLLTPAITEDLVQQALSRSRQASTRPELQAAPPAPDKAEAPPPKAGKRKGGGFSETEWFLAPINPDEVDTKTGKVKVDPSKYEHNPATPDEKRRRFSLKRDDEE